MHDRRGVAVVRLGAASVEPRDLGRFGGPERNVKSAETVLRPWGRWFALRPWKSDPQLGVSAFRSGIGPALTQFLVRV